MLDGNTYDASSNLEVIEEIVGRGRDIIQDSKSIYCGGKILVGRLKFPPCYV